MYNFLAQKTQLKRTISGAINITSRTRNKFSFEDSLKFWTSKEKSNDDETQKRSPRAAVYAAKEQASGFSLSGVWTWFLSKGTAFKTAAAILFALILICIFCYRPAQIYYTEIRDTQKAATELALVQARNDEISKNVAALKTDEGIEDKAISEFGYVKAGEGTAVVSGIEKDDSTNVPAYVNSADIHAPNAWYNPFLDFIFGYQN